MTLKPPIPVILDTDIGGDIDDTWALAMLLRSPELDPKLIVSDTGDTVYRARIIARLLETGGRTDIPVGIGLKRDAPAAKQPQAAWVEDYALERYPGAVIEDGVQAIVSTVMESKTQVTLICIGPVPNIRRALEIEPQIAERTRFVGMHGCFKTSQDGRRQVVPEYNVVADVPAARAALGAPWVEAVITPLDTCGRVRLRSDKYGMVARSPDPLARAVIENYRIWLGGARRRTSSILYDTVAVYLAFSRRLLAVREMGVRVSTDGYTVEDPDGPRLQCAMGWKNLSAFEDLLVARLTGEQG
ncbi:nucleoside hydrolase [Verrucomicrobiota bacterium]